MEDKTWTITKWVLIIFVTGFVAQFGKELTQWVIKQFKKRTGEKETGTADAASPASSIRSAETKLEKKRLKAEAKLAKKTR